MTNEITDSLSERFKHPVIGVFSTFFMLLNYELIFIFLYGDNLVARVEAVTMYINSGAMTVVMPIAYTLIYVVSRFCIDILMSALDRIRDNISLNLSDWTLNLVDHEGLMIQMKKKDDKISRDSKVIRETVAIFDEYNSTVKRVVDKFSPEKIKDIKLTLEKEDFSIEGVTNGIKDFNEMLSAVDSLKKLTSKYEKGSTFVDSIIKAV
ncbi:hypothetical protein ABMA79_04860 [Halobacteriovorax sp. HFRX-2_2]|uniref:hypothetical protein n=1 Tax=unclassified Halobacteriovorax TaxID=2639665 RepID=UPI00371B841B